MLLCSKFNQYNIIIKDNIILTVTNTLMEIEMRGNTKNENDNTILINFIQKNNRLKKINLYIINSTNIHKYKLLNKSLTICAHILIMVIFEIYFFFTFVVSIENHKFIGKIDSYFDNLEPMKVSYIEKQVIIRIISNEYEDKVIKKLFMNYTESMKRQNIILQSLITTSYKMAGVLIIIFMILLGLSIYNRNFIEWKTIIFENIIMFLFLGVFEYYFFINIIMKYEPVTNEEIQYKLTTGVIQFLNMTEISQI